MKRPILTQYALRMNSFEKLAKYIQPIWRQIGEKIDTQISFPWKHFFAFKIVLRVIVCCLRGVGSMSSSRRIPRSIVLFSSGHRWLFFVVSLWACVVVESRWVIFMSSGRRVFLSSTALHT